MKGFDKIDKFYISATGEQLAKRLILVTTGKTIRYRCLFHHRYEAVTINFTTVLSKLSKV